MNRLIEIEMFKVKGVDFKCRFNLMHTLTTK